MAASAEAVDSAAAAWIARRDRDAWSLADQAALDRWLGEATEHKVAYLRLEAAWDRADRLRAYAGGAQPADTRRAAWTRSLPARLTGVAASLALAVVIALQMAPEAYATKVGQSRTAVLKDGSRLELNTDSKVTIHYSKGVRRVKLERGEAFFQVAKDAARPFVVEVGDYRVAATGTAFDVHREGDQIALTVRDGQVSLQRRDLADGTAKPAVFSAGAIVQARPEAVRVVSVAPERVQTALSWRRGLIVFDDTRLADVAAEFNRYNTVKLVITDPALAEAHVGGAFHPTNLDAFVRILGQDLKVSAQSDGDRLLLKAG